MPNDLTQKYKKEELNQILLTNTLISFLRDRIYKTQYFKSKKREDIYSTISNFLRNPSYLESLENREYRSYAMFDLLEDKSIEKEEIAKIAELASRKGTNDYKDLDSGPIYSAMKKYLDEDHTSELAIKDIELSLWKIYGWFTFFIYKNIGESTALEMLGSAKPLRQEVINHINKCLSIVPISFSLVNAISAMYNTKYKYSGDNIMHLMDVYNFEFYSTRKKINDLLGQVSIREEDIKKFKWVDDFFMANLFKIVADPRISEYQKHDFIAKLNEFKLNIFGHALFLEKSVAISSIHEELLDLYLENPSVYASFEEIKNLPTALNTIKKDKKLNSLLESYFKDLDFKINNLKTGPQRLIKIQRKFPNVAIFDGTNNRLGITGKWSCKNILDQVKKFHPLVEALSKEFRVSKLTKIILLSKQKKSDLLSRTTKKFSCVAPQTEEDSSFFVARTSQNSRNTDQPRKERSSIKASGSGSRGWR